jgi:hypothetical protein
LLIKYSKISCSSVISSVLSRRRTGACSQDCGDDSKRYRLPTIRMLRDIFRGSRPHGTDSAAPLTLRFSCRPAPFAVPIPAKGFFSFEMCRQKAGPRTGPLYGRVSCEGFRSV